MTVDLMMVMVIKHENSPW